MRAAALRPKLRPMGDGIRAILGLGRPSGAAEPPDPTLLALLDALPQGAALLDPAGTLLHANTPLRELLGPSLPLRRGMPALSLFEPASRESLRTWLAEGAAAPLEAALAAPEGRPPSLALLRLAPLPEGRHLLLAEDLSERSRRREEAEAGERLRAIGQLAGGIAHDVNNLLAIILGAMDAAVLAAPTIRDELRPAQDAAARGAALVRRLLAFARRQQLDPRIRNLDEAVAAALIDPVGEA